MNMSHFLVGVFSHDTEDVDELLAPYNECDEAYFVPCPLSDEEQRKIMEEYERREDLNESFADYILSYGNAHENEDGSLFCLCNPNAKWDWYDADGGRWADCGMYRLKPGEQTDDFNRVTVRQMDFSPDMDKYHEAEIFWDEYVMGKDRKKHTHTFFKPEYFIERYGTKEKYAEHSADVQRPYAFITPDGAWHETGSMGWFGIDATDRETMEAYHVEWKQAIEKYQDCYLTYVDCHI